MLGEHRQHDRVDERDGALGEDGHAENSLLRDKPPPLRALSASSGDGWGLRPGLITPVNPRSGRASIAVPGGRACDSSSGGTRARTHAHTHTHTHTITHTHTHAHTLTHTWWTCMRIFERRYAGCHGPRAAMGHGLPWATGYLVDVHEDLRAEVRGQRVDLRRPLERRPVAHPHLLSPQV